MRNHIKIVTRKLGIILILLTIPKLSHALIVQGFIGVSLFNAFTLLFLFLFLPIAIIGVIYRALGIKKGVDGKRAKFNAKRSIVLFSKYIIYHTALISGWLLFFNIITKMEVINEFTPLSTNKPIIFHIYIISFAVLGPYTKYIIGKYIKKNYFPPRATNFLRLYLWNIFIFWIASIILNVPLF